MPFDGKSLGCGCHDNQSWADTPKSSRSGTGRANSTRLNSAACVGKTLAAVRSDDLTPLARSSGVSERGPRSP
eukprot:9303553-Pyramimonas_sp.AAC.1